MMSRPQPLPSLSVGSRQRRDMSGLAFLFEHDLFRKPLSTFRDHALEWLRSLGLTKSATLALLFAVSALQVMRCHFAFAPIAKNHSRSRSRQKS
jgi:hypothetical protein